MFKIETSTFTDTIIIEDVAMCKNTTLIDETEIVSTLLFNNCNQLLKNQEKNLESDMDYNMEKDIATSDASSTSTSSSDLEDSFESDEEYFSNQEKFTVKAPEFLNKSKANAFVKNVVSNSSMPWYNNMHLDSYSNYPNLLEHPTPKKKVRMTLPSRDTCDTVK